MSAHRRPLVIAMASTEAAWLGADWFGAPDWLRAATFGAFLIVVFLASSLQDRDTPSPNRETVP